MEQVKNLLGVIKAMDEQTDSSMVEGYEESSGPSIRDRHHGRGFEEKIRAPVTEKGESLHSSCLRRRVVSQPETLATLFDSQAGGRKGERSRMYGHQYCL